MDMDKNVDAPRQKKELGSVDLSHPQRHYKTSCQFLYRRETKPLRSHGTTTHLYSHKVLASNNEYKKFN